MGLLLVQTCKLSIYAGIPVKSEFSYMFLKYAVSYKNTLKLGKICFCSNKHFIVLINISKSNKGLFYKAYRHFRFCGDEITFIGVEANVPIFFLMEVDIVLLLIQKILEYCDDLKTQQILMSEILKSVCLLANHQYGNYVVQVCKSFLFFFL